LEEEKTREGEETEVIQARYGTTGREEGAMSTFRRGNIWWYEFVIHGQRIRESTGSESKMLAVKAERQRRRELEESANGLRTNRPPMLFPAAAREWMSANQARWSNANVAIQGYNLKHLSAYFGAMMLADITSQHIGKYQARRQKEDASNRTINMEIATLRMILKSARMWGNLAPDVKMLPEREEIGRVLTPDEEMRLLAACSKSFSRSLYTAVVVFSNTGLRNAELRHARWRQVDFLKAEFQVGKSKTKGGEGRMVPLNRAALAALQGWRARWPNAKPEEYVFPSEKLMFKGTGAAERGDMTPYAVDPTKPLGPWKRAWHTAKKQAGVECRMHDLRHCFITKLAETQTSDQTIMSLAGHLNRKMLERYSHIRAEAKRQAVASLDERDARPAIQ
jgi:integrase